MITVSELTSIGGGLLVDRSMILKVEASVDGLENFFSKCFL